jgi:hypothetical protein
MVVLALPEEELQTSYLYQKKLSRVFLGFFRFALCPLTVFYKPSRRFIKRAAEKTRRPTSILKPIQGNGLEKLSETISIF